ncbi:biopolymer transporter ExbD [Treponema sp.]|uniref:ExbD/TolR family protein n=1 Tax=Treponema sp. TaxID=166 RepID=UPI00298EB23E|nr:biopolymer transporter ExbD [Treponema sp.]MCQ2241100.1 biopolymer transporter ExbD [Treponema sp.]
MKVSSRRSNGGVGGVDLSPMLDVIFQLILFFLVSTTFSILPAINVNLPESSTSQGVETSSITITVKEDGNLWFNDDKVSMKELEKLLKEFDTGDRPRNEFPVSIQADTNVTNGKIVALFDVIRFSGFSAVSLRTTGKK